MYQGKHCKKKNSSWNKSALIVVSLILITTMVLGGTLAFLLTSTEDVENTFTPSRVTTLVEETLSGDKKTNVIIKNTGDTDAFIRAAVVVTWQDEEGNIYGQKPVENTDYTISYNVDEKKKDSAKWYLGNDGFYYWPSPVAYDPDPTDDNVPPNCFTGTLINSCTTQKTMIVGETTYYLTVEIIGSGIQNKPASVFNTEWKSSGLEVKNTDKDPMEWTLGQKQGG